MTPALLVLAWRDAARKNHDMAEVNGRHSEFSSYLVATASTYERCAEQLERALTVVEPEASR